MFVSDSRHELVDTERQLAAAHQRAGNWWVCGSEISQCVTVCVCVCDLRHELEDTQRQLAAAQQRAANWAVIQIFVCVCVCVICDVGYLGTSISFFNFVGLMLIHLDTFSPSLANVFSLWLLSPSNLILKSRF